MGQVWSKASFDGNSTYRGGRGSVIAVTAQNPGKDRQWDTDDDNFTRPNEIPVWPSQDASRSYDPEDFRDSVRGFNGAHVGGVIFGFADGHAQFIPDAIDLKIYRHLSTIAGADNTGDDTVY